MKGLITKKEAREFKRRWKAVNEFELQELRKTPPAKKLLQLSALMASVKAFPGWDEALSAEEIIRNHQSQTYKIHFTKV